MTWLESMRIKAKSTMVDQGVSLHDVPAATAPVSEISDTSAMVVSPSAAVASEKTRAPAAEPAPAKQASVGTSTMVDTVTHGSQGVGLQPRSSTAARRAKASVTAWPTAAIAWLATLTADQLPAAPFKWHNGTVLNSAGFLARLQQDAAEGPAGCRARWGALQEDVCHLAQMLGGPLE